MHDRPTGANDEIAAFPTFAEFYAAVHKRPPLPWQERLATQAAAGNWPTEIGVPTGLGKTACLDIAVWALASQSDRPAAKRTAPTRLWYVVDRRLLVDSAHEHGIELRDQLASAEHGPLAAVANGLRRIAGGSSDASPLHVTRLRGSAALGERPPHPAQPALCFATVAMYASRLLFRGYGSSTSMRPIDAAHAGIDSLILLDEAHLTPALIGLANPLEQCDLGDPARVIGPPRSRPRFVGLTATGRAGDDERFELDGADYAHPLVQRRLSASKPTRLVPTTGRSLASTIARELLASIAAFDDPPACLVFVNTTRLASDVAEKLHGKIEEVMVLTGRMRDHEAAALRKRLLADDGLPAGRPNAKRAAPLVVVATQTLEVGADLDADVLVTQSAGVRALVQRFGRLNRLGDRQDAVGIIVHPADEKDPAIYGQETIDLWERLGNTIGPNDAIDLGPGRIAQALGTPSDHPLRAGELLPIHLWEWAKTTVPPHREAPPQLFFAGIDDEPPRVSVLWRAWLPAPGERCLPPVRQTEAVEISISVARQLLETRADDANARRLAADRSTVEPIDAQTVRPGDTVLLDVCAGGYDPVTGLDPDAESVVLDVAVLTGSMLPLHPKLVRHLLPDVSAGEIASCFSLATDSQDPDAELDQADWRVVHQAVTSLMAANRPHPAIRTDEWNTLRRRVADGHVQLPQPGRMPVVSWVERRMGTDTPIASDVFDDLSFDASSVTLNDHLDSVGEIAARLGRTAGLGESHVEALRWAGQLHDIGKADIRFQRWLDPDGGGELLAKSTGTQRESRRQAAGWPQGGRHEILSSRLMDAALEAGLELPAGVDLDLVRHLVLTHHGHGRPSLPVIDDRMPTRISYAVNGCAVTVSGDLSEEDLDQPRRFRALNRRYGYWGLALLEALLRQADHIASRTTEVA